VLFLRTWVLAQVLFFAGTMMSQRKFANSSCMEVVKAMGTGSKLRWSAGASATFQVMQVSEVFIVSLFCSSMGVTICWC
jgi:hypothetical protein